MPVDYQQGKIYKIVSSQTDKIYIGSTVQPRLCNRLTKHKRDYKCWQNKKRHYRSSFELIKFDDVNIVLIESFPCNNKDELHAREQYYIEQHKNLAVNRINANGHDRKACLKKYNNSAKGKQVKK